MMEKEYIQKLLDSYMAAETTKEEEQLLSDYFSTHQDIPAEWRNISVMFRSIRHYRQKPDASHKRTILKWSAAAAVIAFIFGTGWLLMRQEVTDKPSDAIVQIAESSTTDVIESKQEIIAEEAPVIVQPQTRQSTRKRHGRRTQKAVAQVNQSVTDKPSDAIVQIAESPTTDVIESKQEIIAEEAPVIVQPQTRQSTRKRHGRRTQKAVAQVNQSEPLPDVSLSAHNLIPAKEPARSLSTHRDEMRKNIRATFENSNTFIAQNTVEL